MKSAFEDLSDQAKKAYFEMAKAKYARAMRIKPEDVRPWREWPPNGELSAWVQQHFSPDFRGYAVDIGASDGISINSTYVLEKNGWNVLSIEPNPCFWKRLKQLRAFVMTCACDAEPKSAATFHCFEMNPEAYSSLRPTYPKDFPPELGWSQFEVPVMTLEQCLARYEFPCLDVLCIDTEGTEQDVLRGLDLAKWSPKVIIIEAWQPGKHDEYLKPFGYERKWKTADNDCYIKP